ncbi:MAG: tetratricopeptide repeat protein, partial [Mesorhizobium sp.]
LHAYSIRWAIQNGLRTYDLGTGDFSYKYSFGSKERLVEGVRIDPTNSRRNRLDRRSLPSVMSSVRKLRQEGKLHLAERGCRQVLETEPSNLEARRLLNEVVAARHIEEQFASALQRHRGKQYLDARRIYLEVLAANPRHYGANYMLGVLCLQAGQYQAADTYLARATEINPKAAAAYNNRGHALRGLKRYDEALACYEKAIAVKPDFVQAMNNRGVTLRALGRIDEALTLKPDFAKALINRNQLRVPLPRDRLSIADDVDILE